MSKTEQRQSAEVVHLWVPDYESSVGGIQTFTRFFVQAVGECLPAAKITVFSKHDNSQPVFAPHQPPLEFRCSGWWPARLRTAAFSARLLTAALRERPDLIMSTHVNFAPVAQWLKRLRPVKFAAVAHGVDVWGEQRRNGMGALRRADRVLAVSHFTRQRLLEHRGFEPEQIGLLPNTVDTERFTPEHPPRHLLKRFGLKAGQPVILTIARLAGEERYKGYDQIIRALPEIRRSVPEVRYLIGGTGPDRGRLERLVAELGLTGAVTFAGFIPNHELVSYYNLCNVFAMPSKGEGFGIVYLEALACGKPVLAGNKDGSVDALLNGELGVLIDPDEVGDIATALSAMLTRQHPLAILQAPDRLRARVIEAYGYRRFVERVAEQLHQLGIQTG